MSDDLTHDKAKALLALGRSNTSIEVHFSTGLTRPIPHVAMYPADLDGAERALSHVLNLHLKAADTSISDDPIITRVALMFSNRNFV